MFSHTGGGILVNRNSKTLDEATIKAIDHSIKRQTTREYGNGFQSYSGLTGETMIEIMTGLMMSADEEMTGRRITQVAHVSSFLRQKYDFPVIAGGHALYISAD